MREFSFGIIPLKKTEEGYSVLIIQHGKGHWAFPKGHADPGELPQQTAERELQEETGLTVESYLFPEPLIEDYFFSFQGQKVFKSVTYFIALVRGRIKLQEAEINDYIWVPLEKAADKMTYKQGKQLCNKLIDMLKPI